MTFQRKLLLGVSGMVLPALLVGAEAIRSNALERHALEALGTSLGRNRTYAELETAMFNQSEVIWRYVTGLDSAAKKDFQLSGEVVHYWFDRWKAELGPGQDELAQAILDIQKQYEVVADSVFRLTDSGHREQAYQVAVVELRNRIQPALTALNRQIYRKTRETSVQAAFGRVEEIVNTERKVLLGILVATLVLGSFSAWVMARSLSRPINDLRGAMAIVGAGNLEHPVQTDSQDEIGDLARAFAGMTDRLREAQAQLVQKEKLASLGEMAAGVAHGLRNPLSSLRASAQLVLKHPNSAAAPEQLQAIIDEVDRLDHRINHLLTFSRPAPFRPNPQSVDPLVRGVLPTFGERIKSQGVSLEVAIDPGLPDVRVDPLKIEQALQEVIGNALDAMPGGGQLKLNARAGDNSDRQKGILVTVLDTGRGISPETMREVGQPFFTTRAEGTGLGLATARRFIEQHGGTLELQSEVGKGTTVSIWLPLGAA